MSALLALGLTPTLALVVGLTSLLYAIYLWLPRPRPLPGIPYNAEAAKSLFGDIVPMSKHATKTGEVFAWIRDQGIKHRSPIFQVFARPFGKPWVIVTDFREAQDVLLRRTKEFDRATFQGDLFHGVLPEHHISMKTNDRFKRHRRWLQDLMTPDFLNKVAAPRIFTSFEDVVRLWDEKARLARGHPIAVAEDVYLGALDAAWAAVFGSDPSDSVTRAHISLITSLESVTISTTTDEALVPKAPNPAVIQSVLTLTDSLETCLKSPIPRLHHWVLRQFPFMRKAYKVKEEFIKQQVKSTQERFSVGTTSGDVRCAMDDIIRREIALAKKEERKPMLHSRDIYDEIFGFIIGAHETTSTTVTWALKLIADNPDKQSKLRLAIQAAYTDALKENRNPEVREIATITIPYLDAVIEELFRCSGTAPAITRTTEVNVTILGKHIPAGYDVHFLTTGPSMSMPAYTTPESLRNPTALAAKHVISAWEGDSGAEFKPERWLVRKADGEEEFDSTAGPMLGFGLGPRGCFGRRMAYLEIRIVVVLILFNFELEKCPAELSTYAAVDRITHQPQQCYVRLKKLN